MIQLDNINQRNNLDFLNCDIVTFTKTDGPVPGAEDNFGQLCGEQDGGNNYSNCPLEQWFRLRQFSAFESNKGLRDFVRPCGCVDTNLTGLFQWTGGLVQTL